MSFVLRDTKGNGLLECPWRPNADDRHPARLQMPNPIAYGSKIPKRPCRIFTINRMSHRLQNSKLLALVTTSFNPIPSSSTKRSLCVS